MKVKTNTKQTYFSNSEPFYKDIYFLPLLFLICADLCVFIFSFAMGYVVRFHTNLYYLFPPPTPPYIPEFAPYFKLSLLIAAFGLFVFERFGLYEKRVGLDRNVHIASLILAILVTYIFIMALLFNYRGYTFSRLTIGLAIPMTCFGVIFAHALLKKTQFFMIRKGIMFFKTILIGPELECQRINLKLQEHHGSKFQVLGYVNTHTEDGAMQQQPLMPCLGNKEQLDNILQKEPVDNVIIAMPANNELEIVNIMKTCLNNHVTFRVIPNLYDILTQRIHGNEIEAIPTVAFGETPLCINNTGFLAKRFMDIIVSSVALILSFPLMLFIALLIKFDSKGSIFYVQERIGNDGRRFKMLKFRSMVDEAERDTGPTWATSKDPRTTYIGRFLRKYNLDELPQFLNVLRGDMSLVGPRPERPYFVNKFKEEIPYYTRRHMVKTGITGWAQVNGWRGDTSVMERTKYDLYYIKNWSLLLDLKIIIKTLISFKNAY